MAAAGGRSLLERIEALRAAGADRITVLPDNSVRGHWPQLNARSAQRIMRNERQYDFPVVLRANYGHACGFGCLCGTRTAFATAPASGASA